MKQLKTFAILLAFLMAILPVTPVSAANVKISEWTFEDGTVLSDTKYQENGYNLNTWTAVQELVNDAYSGETAMKLTATGIWMGTDFSVPGNTMDSRRHTGKVYKFSCAVKAGENNTSFALPVYGTYYPESEGSQYTLNVGTINATTEYTVQNFYFSIPQRDFIWDVKFGFMDNSGQISAGNEFYFDDILLEELAAFEIDKPSCVPAADTKAVIEGNEIRVAFTTDIKDAATANFTVSDNEVTQVSVDGSVATLTLAYDLIPGTIYTVGVTDMYDVAGRSCSASYTFEVLDTEAPPVITRVTPGNNSSGVDTETDVIITFAGVVEIPENSVKINGSTDLIEKISTEDNINYLVELKTLAPAELYTVTVENAVTEYGVELPGAYEFKFYTKIIGSIVYENDFESGSLATFGGGYGAEKSVTTDYAANGEYSLKAESTMAYGSVETPKGLWNSGSLYKITYNATLDPTNKQHKQIAVASSYWGDEGTKNTKIGGVSPSAAGVFAYGEASFYVEGSAGDTIIYFYGDNAVGKGIFYVDDIKLYKMPELGLLPVSVPENGKAFGVDEEFRLTFSEAMKVPEQVLLNGEVLSDVTADSNIIKIKHSTLKNNSSYTLEVKGIKDSYGRTADDIKIQFMTEGKYTASGLKLDKSKLSQGMVTATVDSIKNNSTDTTNIAVKLMLYKDGFMLNDSVNNVIPVAPGDTVYFEEASIYVPDITDGEYMLVAAVWNDDTIMPVCKSILLTEED